MVRTSSCEYSTSTAKADEHREAVAQECHDGCHCGSPACVIEEGDKHCDEGGAYTFGNIDHEDDDGGAFAECAQDIRHANFATAVIANIEVFATQQLTHPVACWN